MGRKKEIIENEEVVEQDLDKKFNGKRELITPQDWMEWQANVFAASLLMPERAFKTAVISRQKKRGINRNVGKVYLDMTDYSERDFREMISYLQEVFGTSRRAIEIRLNELNILVEDERRKANHYSISNN